jgi:hypothetical protein
MTPLGQWFKEKDMPSVFRGSDNFDTAGGNAVKAWVNFNGTGTVAIRANYNVASITDNGTGDYTVNFTTALPDANYAVVGTGQNNTHAIETVVLKSGATPLTTTGANIRTVFSSGYVDSPFVLVAIFR